MTDEPPDAAWYEQQRLKALARAAGVSMPVMAAAAAEAAAATQAPVSNPDATGWQKVGRSLGEIGARIAEKVKWRRGRVYNPKILVTNVKVPDPQNSAASQLGAGRGGAIRPRARGRR